MAYLKCVNNPKKPCIGREKISINGVMPCCEEIIKDENELVLNIVDAIEFDLKSIHDIVNVCSKISYASSILDRKLNKNFEEVFLELKRFSLTVYQFQEKISQDNDIYELVKSFLHIVHQWFMNMYFNEFCSTAINYTDSIKSDLLTIEMALGACVLTFDNEEESFDDIFF